MKAETIRTDITVVGGGLAGVCAAVAAARLGRTVALVQNRPVLVRDYRVEVCRGGEWTILLRETDNRKRNRVHRLEQPVAAEQLRVVVEATAGSKHAQIIEIRVYE
jgi:tRNA U34 5-carboxymethylaminomethyl modifying enzyme MnmG/GidA